MPANPANFNIDNVRVAKIMGSSVAATSVVRGMCLTRPCMGTITDVKDAKIAIYGIPLDSVTTETKGTVLLKSAEEVKEYVSRCPERCHSCLAAGVRGGGVESASEVPPRGHSRWSATS